MSHIYNHGMSLYEYFSVNLYILPEPLYTLAKKHLDNRDWEHSQAEMLISQVEDLENQNTNLEDEYGELKYQMALLREKIENQPDITHKEIITNLSKIIDYGYI